MKTSAYIVRHWSERFTLFIPKCEQFSEHEVRGKLWAINRNQEDLNNFEHWWTHFQLKYYAILIIIIKQHDNYLSKI